MSRDTKPFISLESTLAAKTPAQREAAKQRRLARKERQGGGSTKSSTPRSERSDLENVSEGAKSFDPTDYTARTGYKRTQRWVLALIEELELLVEGKVPEDPTHAQVGDLASIRVHLEKAIAHAKESKNCLMCPTNELPKIKKHWKDR